MHHLGRDGLRCRINRPDRKCHHGEEGRIGSHPGCNHLPAVRKCHRHAVMMPPYSRPSARSRWAGSSGKWPSGTVPARKTPSGNVSNRNSFASAPLVFVRGNASRTTGEARRMRQAPAMGANRPPQRNGCGEAILQISSPDCKCLTLPCFRSAPAYGGRSPPPRRSGSRMQGAANPRASAADLRPDSQLRPARNRANPIGAAHGP